MPGSSKWLMHCPFCAGEAKLEDKTGIYILPFRIHCSNSRCGVTTIQMRTKEIAAIIWNRRVQRKPPIRSKGLRIT